jgi:uroporphyrinogen-III synthase
MSPSALAGRHIVVTRPQAQLTNLCSAINERCAIPVKFPLLTISAVERITALQDAAIALDGYELVVFVSPNAVEHALNAMLRHRAWPAALPAACMGKSSELALAHFGVANIIAPQARFDSDSLLALPQLADVRGHRVLVCRGDGGRELLVDTLRARGAHVDVLTCYRRTPAALDPAPLIRLWQANQLDAITLTSSESVHHFAQLIGHLGRRYWQRTPTFVTHQRIKDTAKAFDLTTLVLTEPADAGLLAGMERYFGEVG